MTGFIIVAAANQRKNKYQDIYTKLNVQYKYQDREILHIYRLVEKGQRECDFQAISPFKKTYDLQIWKRRFLPNLNPHETFWSQIRTIIRFRLHCLYS